MRYEGNYVNAWELLYEDDEAIAEKKAEQRAFLSECGGDVELKNARRMLCFLSDELGMSIDEVRDKLAMEYLLFQAACCCGE